MEGHGHGIETDRQGGMEDVHTPVFQSACFQKDDDGLIVRQNCLQFDQIRRTKVNDGLLELVIKRGPIYRPPPKA